MKLQAPRLRNKTMLLCGLLTVGMVAAPGAFARDYHEGRYSGNHYGYGHDSRGWHDYDHDRGNGNVGALLAGALIGGVIVNALDHSHDYSRTYYSTPYYGSSYYPQPTYYEPRTYYRPRTYYAPPPRYSNGGYGSYGNGYYGDSRRGSGYYDGY